MKIVTDSAADLSPAEANELDISVAPLSIQFTEGEVDSNAISPDDFYTRLRAMFPHIPTTSQPSAGLFSRIYEKLTDLGEEVVSIHISSGLSGTLESARLGASQLHDRMVDFVDSHTISGGERFQVLAAALAAKAGKSKEFIHERLAKINAATEVIYTLDTLTYLQRGGRIGRVQALAGSLLHIKPLIHVDKTDGKYSTLGKERTIPKAIEAMVDHISTLYTNSTPLWATILHGQMVEQAQKLADLTREKLNVSKLEIMRISPALGVHTGPGIVGLAVVPIALMEGLD